jgi:arginase
MRPVHVFAPYVMGDFSPARFACSRHNWRLVAPPELSGSPTERMGTLSGNLAGQVEAILNDGKMPLAIVGDCTFSIGIVAGLQRKFSDFTLIWFDAHGDFNTHETSPSGFIGGMPLAMLCGMGEQTIMQGAGARVHPETDVIFSDGRDLDPEEAVAVQNSDIVHLPDIAQLLSYSLPDKPIYIHFDSDVLNLADNSAVNYPAEGGATLDVVTDVLTYLAQSGKVVAVSVTMWNPEKDQEAQAEQVVLGLVERLIENLPTSA